MFHSRRLVTWPQLKLKKKKKRKDYGKRMGVYSKEPNSVHQTPLTSFSQLPFFASLLCHFPVLVYAPEDVIRGIADLPSSN